MNRLAPAHMASLIMGTWFFASATGNFAAGLIAAATGAEGGRHGRRQAGPRRLLDRRLGRGRRSAWRHAGHLAAHQGLMHLDTLRDAEPAARGAEGDR